MRGWGIIPWGVFCTLLLTDSMLATGIIWGSILVLGIGIRIFVWYKLRNKPNGDEDLLEG